MKSNRNLAVSLGMRNLDKYWIAEKIVEFKALLESEKTRVAELKIFPAEQEKASEFYVKCLELQILAVKSGYSSEQYKNELKELYDAMIVSYEDWLKSKTELFKNASGGSRIYHKDNYAVLIKEMEEKYGIKKIFVECQKFSVEKSDIAKLEAKHKKVDDEYCAKMEKRNIENSTLMNLNELISDLVRIQKYCQQDVLEEKELADMQKRIRSCFAYQIEKDSDSINRLDKHGFNLFHYACMAGDETTLSELLSKGGRADISPGNGFSPAHIVAELNHLHAEELLGILTKDKDVSAMKNSRQVTLLHSAAYGGNVKAVVWLIDNTNVDINALVDNKGRRTPLRTALLNGQVAVAHYLKSRAKPISLTQREMCFMFDKAKRLAKEGQADAANDFYACLALATPQVECPRGIARSHPDPVFIDRSNASVDSSHVNFLSALVVASKLGNLQDVKYVFDNKKFKAHDKKFQAACSTSLFIAVYEGHTEVVIYFLSKNVRDNKLLDDSRFERLREDPDYLGLIYTDVMAAILKGHVDIAKAFYNVGVWLTDAEQGYLLDVAKYNPDAADSIYFCLKIPQMELEKFRCRFSTWNEQTVSVASFSFLNRRSESTANSEVMTYVQQKMLASRRLI